MCFVHICVYSKILSLLALHDFDVMLKVHNNFEQFLITVYITFESKNSGRHLLLR